MWATSSSGLTQMFLCVIFLHTQVSFRVKWWWTLMDLHSWSASLGPRLWALTCCIAVLLGADKLWGAQCCRSRCHRRIWGGQLIINYRAPQCSTLNKLIHFLFKLPLLCFHFMMGLSTFTSCNFFFFFFISCHFSGQSHCLTLLNFQLITCTLLLQQVSQLWSWW